MKLTFVTIFFEKDFHLLLLQLRSLSKFLDENVIKEILVVYNSNSDLSDELKIEMDRELNYFKKYSKYLRLLKRSDISCDLSSSGWKSQQIIKLEISRFVSSDFYCVLDSKNMIVRPVSFRDFFSESGLPYALIQDYNKHSIEFKEFYINSLNIFGVEPISDNLKNALPTVTPHLLEVKSCEDMKSAVLERTGFNYSKYINSVEDGEKTTEFLLYSGFLKSKNAIESKYALVKHRNSYTLFGTSPKNEDAVQEYIDKAMHDESVKFFGIHLKRYPNLSDASKNKIIKLLLMVGLIESEDTFEQLIMSVSSGIKVL